MWRSRNQYFFGVKKYPPPPRDECLKKISTFEFVHNSNFERRTGLKLH